jgi:hypothetical protein
MERRSEVNMLRRGWKILLLLVVAGLLAVGVAGGAGLASGEESNPQKTAPQSPKVAAGETEARKLLLLMDTDKNGKVSRQEFMNFMAAEFDRLDKNKDGELDVKELTRSQLATARTSGGHR